MFNHKLKHFNKSLGFDEHKQIAIDLLKLTTKILDEFNIDYFLISGTLLGYVRHNDFIPFDDDMDLIVHSDIKKHMPDIMKKHNSNISIIMTDSLVKMCLKDKVINLNNVKMWSKYLLNKKDCYYWPFIDLFIFEYTNDLKSIKFFNREWNKDDFFPIQRKKFNNIIVSIPANPHYFLSTNYGIDYMKILKSSNWNHKNECPIKEQYTVTIDQFNEHIMKK